MLIRKKRINNLAKYLNDENIKSIKICLADPERYLEKCLEIGFSADLAAGERVLPKKVNLSTKVNAEGYFIVHKDQPMITRYRPHYWTRTEWAGRGETREVTEYVDIPYRCYPRTPVAPYLMELSVENHGTSKTISTDVIANTIENRDKMKRTINVFLSLFGECEILHEPFDVEADIPIIDLNWEILPPGDYPWAQLSALMDKILKNKPRTHLELMKDNLNHIYGFAPDFRAFGQAGFNGYVVLGFRAKNIYVLESSVPDNATYVFSSDWEDLTKQTKSTIINQNLATNRIIHNGEWKKRIKSLLEV